VEIAHSRDATFIRDSKDPEGPILSFSRTEWTSFLSGAALGEFDLVDPE